MCGTLKYGVGDTSVARLGNPIPITVPHTGKSGKAVWSGFAKQEKTEWWQKTGNAVSVEVHATSFVEGKTEIRIPKTCKMYGLGLRRNVMVNGKVIGEAGSTKILTRAAISPLEKSIHSRWPIVLDKMSLLPYTFTEADIIRSEAR